MRLTLLLLPFFPFSINTPPFFKSSNSSVRVGSIVICRTCLCTSEFLYACVGVSKARKYSRRLEITYPLADNCNCSAASLSLSSQPLLLLLGLVLAVAASHTASLGRRNGSVFTSNIEVALQETRRISSQPTEQNSHCKCQVLMVRTLLLVLRRCP